MTMKCQFKKRVVPANNVVVDTINCVPDFMQLNVLLTRCTSTHCGTKYDMVALVLQH